jgi:hypothetical protein
MIEQILKDIEKMQKQVDKARIVLDKEMKKMSEKDREIFIELKRLAEEGSIEQVKNIINKCYK